MRRFALVGLAIVGACYGPTVPAGIDCSGGGACPRDFVCSPATLTCEREGHDAGIDTVDAIDAPPDGPPCTPAPAGMQTFDVTGTIVTFVVPTCGPLRIEAWGAQGGAGFQTHIGGKGAHVAGTFTLPVGETLKILVGGEGIAGINSSSQRSGSGGGGTFVVEGTQTPLVIAGGGGGATGGGFSVADGGPGQAGTAGQAGDGTVGGVQGGAGGIDGNGGTTFQITNPSPGAYQQATAGGGLLTDGMGSSNGGANNGTPNGAGIAFVNGGAGGAGGSQGRDGGFGGGGSTGFTGGGGGGYSGGGNGGGNITTYAGGGGGSFADGTANVAEAGINAGNGRVTISW